MKVVFFSNFLNHHQLPMCNEFVSHKNIDFIFVATEPIPQERIRIKYLDLNSVYDFVVRSYESEKATIYAYELAEEADIVIFGSAPFSFLEHRMKTGKITFRFCERSLKKGYWRRFIPRTAKKIYREYIQYKKLPLYILGASAYTANDLKICGFNEKKCYTWGYFPETREYEDIDLLIKQKNKMTILWVARLIELKHPELAICLAKKLKSENVSFTIKMIGDGSLRSRLEKIIHEEKLEKEVILMGALTAEQVRKEMENAGIFLFTSDFHEGWGAVVNEAMNSACATVVSHACGASPFLVRQNYNGIVFESENFEEMYQDIWRLLNDLMLQEKLGKNAYFTIQEKWNAREAVERFLILVNELSTKEHADIYSDGPCSLSRLFTNKWYTARRK